MDSRGFFAPLGLVLLFLPGCGTVAVWSGWDYFTHRPTLQPRSVAAVMSGDVAHVYVEYEDGESRSLVWSVSGPYGNEVWGTDPRPEGAQIVPRLHPMDAELQGVALHHNNGVLGYLFADGRRDAVCGIDREGPFAPGRFVYPTLLALGLTPIALLFDALTWPLQLGHWIGHGAALP